MRRIPGAYASVIDPAVCCRDYLSTFVWYDLDTVIMPPKSASMRELLLKMRLEKFYLTRHPAGYMNVSGASSRTKERSILAGRAYQSCASERVLRMSTGKNCHMSLKTRECALTR